MGYAEAEFQYRSNDADASRTTGPIMAKSRSTKLTSSLAPKYSSPRLRPPGCSAVCWYWCPHSSDRVARSTATTAPADVGQTNTPSANDGVAPAIRRLASLSTVRSST